MHAVVVEEIGGPEKLLWRERPEPVPGPGQVTVRLKLTSVNFADIAARRGTGVTQVAVHARARRHGHGRRHR